MTQTAEAPNYIITYSDAIEEQISGLRAEVAHYHELYYQANRELSYVYDLFEVSQETLTVSHKASVLATVRYLQTHERERNEHGYIKMDTWQVASLAKQGDGTLRKNWEALSRELRIRDGQEIETDVGNVPIFDRLVIRVPTDDRERYPQGYYLETYMKERDITYHPERYRPQTPIEWGGKRKDAGRKKCPRCGSWMKAKDHIRKVQREHICSGCNIHLWDEERRVSNEVPVDAPVEQAEASKNQVDCCYPDSLDEAEIEASKPQLDEVDPSPIKHQDAVCSPEALTHAPIPPEALRSLPICCCHRAKEPYNARPARVPQKAKSNDPATWSTYEQALATYQDSLAWKNPYDGIGFMCDGSFTGVDLDHCINDQGEISDQALDLVALFGSYTYITPSGRGLRIIIRARKPGDRCRWPGVEIYDQVRFFTWTPDHLAGTSETIEDCQAELDALYKELVPDKIPSCDFVPPLQFPCSSSSEEILGKAAKNAKFAKLWSGDASDYRKQDGTPDHSRADLALCEILAWAGGDVSTIERLFEHSGLMREKWNRADYRERTINRALGLQQRRAS